MMVSKKIYERLEQLEKTVDHTAKALEQHTKVGYRTSSNFVSNFEILFKWQKGVDQSIHRLEQHYYRDVRDESQTETENKLTYNTYPTGRVYLDEGWYTEDDLRKIQDALERQNKHIKESMGELKTK